MCYFVVFSLWDRDSSLVCQMLPLWKQHPVQQYLIFVTCTTCSERMKLFCHYAYLQSCEQNDTICHIQHMFLPYISIWWQSKRQHFRRLLIQQKRNRVVPRRIDLISQIWDLFSCVSRQRSAEHLHLTASLGFWAFGQNPQRSKRSETSICRQSILLLRALHLIANVAV